LGQSRAVTTFGPLPRMRSVVIVPSCLFVTEH